jgi:hypothetical protein
MRAQGLVRHIRHLVWLAVFALLVPAGTTAEAQQTAHDVDVPSILVEEVRQVTRQLGDVRAAAGAGYEQFLADAWHSRHALSPVLEDQVFQYNTSPNRYGLPPFYELHVWAWRANPHGAFVDRNPRVSCEGQ